MAEYGIIEQNAERYGIYIIAGGKNRYGRPI
jgi:hypothetical protein